MGNMPHCIEEQEEVVVARERRLALVLNLQHIYLVGHSLCPRPTDMPKIWASDIERQGPEQPCSAQRRRPRRLGKPLSLRTVVEAVTQMSMKQVLAPDFGTVGGQVRCSDHDNTALVFVGRRVPAYNQAGGDSTQSCVDILTAFCL